MSGPSTFLCSSLVVIDGVFFWIGLALQMQIVDDEVIQFPPEMDENWVRYGLAKLGQISRTKLAEDAVLCVHNTASALNR